MAGLPKSKSIRKIRNEKHLRRLIIAIIIALILAVGFYGSIIFATTKPVEKEIEGGKYYHQPYRAQKCDSCHMTAKGEERRLKAPVEELCFTCHKDKAQELTKHSVHQPFSEGKCLVCHEPHKSNNPNLLVEQVNGLCAKCHRELRNRLESSPHSSIDGTKGKGSCLNCHQSHSSDFPSLGVGEPVALCKSCHNQGPTKRNHPVGKPFIDERTGRELTCSSTCHEPHGSEYVPMLRLPNNDSLCLTCHQGVGILF